MNNLPSEKGQKESNFELINPNTAGIDIGFSCQDTSILYPD